ncbi:MAG: chemotaxis protein CheB [Ferruginibacter sp.]
MPKMNTQVVKSTNQFPVVGIGASAGGLDAFKQLLKAIPEDSGMAYVLVQHLDPKHESLLPELLQKVTNIPVMEISDDLRVEPDHIYIIPSNKMMIANDGVLQLSPRPPKNRNERNLPIDVFFTSLAEVHQSHAIGVVLSGTASDGTLGLKAIKDHGGITFAQDEDSAAYEGMPHSAAQAGVVDFILPPGEIPQKLLEVVGKVNISDDELQNIPLQEEDVYKQMLTLLRLRKGTDFTYYKQTTIRRRILRRMAINKNEDLTVYLKFLRENKAEQDILYQDLLIPVTDFFRDPKIFDTLCKTIFPAIIENKTGAEPIRIWVAGCSTGEEVYSIAICLKELLSESISASGFRAESYQRVQIFATDISEPAIAKARAGVYSKTDIKGLSDKQLKEFFTKTTGIYQANKSIRDMCIFAVHNFLKDPPFSKIDFISCRNVLIYMEPYLQKKALTTFHYALNANGFLLLGKSETTGGVPDLFAAHDKKDKIFTRKDVPGSFIHTTTQPKEESIADSNVKAKRENIRTDFQKTADDIMLSKYTPAGVVINEAMDIVHFRGSTGNYLEPSPGKASLNLLKMAKEGLAFELRNILHKAKKENETVIKENIPVQIHEVLRNISIEAIPLPNMAEPHYLILFRETVPAANIKQPTQKVAAKRQNDEKDLRIKQLELELAQVRDDMRSITEDQETVNEELQSANEELLSSSEELQSLNEEMETSKEELQSTNEELTVVNQEMIGLNEQVTEARDYAEAIVATVHQPLLVLNKNLRIKSANDSFYKTFQVSERDTEDRLIYELGSKQWNTPALRDMLEDILPNKTKFENFELTYVFPNIGARTMLLNAREITRDKDDEKLILLAIEDITEKATAHKKIEESENQFSQMAELMPQKIWTSDAEGNKNYFNKTLLDYTGMSAEELKGSGWKKMIHPDDCEKDEILWQESISTGKDYESENRLLRKDGKYLWHLTRAVAIKDADGKIKTWVGSKTEIQVQKELEEELEEKIQQRTNQLIASNEELQARNGELFVTKERLMSEYARSLIEASLDPLVTISTNGKITDMNLATENITGLSREKLTGTNFFDYFTEPQKAREVYEQVFANGSVVNAPLTLHHVDGVLTDIFLNGSVYKNSNGNVLGVVLVARDVTEEKRIAHELTEAIVFAELATGIAEDAKRKAEDATHIAEDAVKAKQQFLSNMSHEIRTPMNAIIGFTKVVLKTELTAKQREYLTAIKLSGNSLIVLINDILDLAKVDAGKMAFEEIPFKMSSSISAMIHLFETKVQEKNLELVKVYDDKIPEVLLGDPVRLHQIILNLVSNAVKFTSKGKITVTLRLLEEDNEKVSIEFSVADTGTGIAENKTEKIFENFHQASSDTSRLYGGTGLGLAIVKQLVESQGGSIQVKSKVDEGSVFSFILSFKKTDAQAESEIEMLEVDAENKNIKVLVVEDIALNQLLMKTLLDDFGFERDIAANGKIALEKLQEKNYDIILMDLQMPEMNGFEATEYIRNKMKLKIPIIALTADVTTVDLEKCKAVGMNDYIAKPVDERILYSKIVGLVKKTVEKKSNLSNADTTAAIKKTNYTDLTYLTGITRFDTKLMMEMIELYQEQTPVLIKAIKKSLQEKDWDGLQAAAHKMIPSFSIMGISKDYETMAKQIQEYTGEKKELKKIQELALQLEHVCNEACTELKEEYNTLKNTKQ